jgi:predicted DNA-binding transcriptional regulator AlpA
MFETSKPVLLDMKDVERMTTLSRAAINRLIAKNEFPKQVPITSHRRVFVEHEIYAWISEQVAKHRIEE